MAQSKTIISVPSHFIDADEGEMRTPHDGAVLLNDEGAEFYHTRYEALCEIAMFATHDAVIELIEFNDGEYFLLNERHLHAFCSSPTSAIRDSSDMKLSLPTDEGSNIYALFTDGKLARKAFFSVCQDATPSD